MIVAVTKIVFIIFIVIVGIIIIVIITIIVTYTFYIIIVTFINIVNNHFLLDAARSSCSMTQEHCHMIHTAMIHGPVFHPHVRLRCYGQEVSDRK